MKYFSHLDILKEKIKMIYEYLENFKVNNIKSIKIFNKSEKLRNLININNLMTHTKKMNL